MCLDDMHARKSEQFPRIRRTFCQFPLKCTRPNPLSASTAHHDGRDQRSSISRTMFRNHSDSNTDPSVAFFFISYILICSVMLLNVVIAVLLVRKRTQARARARARTHTHNASLTAALIGRVYKFCDAGARGGRKACGRRNQQA